jgi:hypothetical protein
MKSCKIKLFDVKSVLKDVFVRDPIQTETTPFTRIGE